MEEKTGARGLSPEAASALPHPWPPADEQHHQDRPPRVLAGRQIWHNRATAHLPRNLGCPQPPSGRRGSTTTAREGAPPRPQCADEQATTALAVARKHADAVSWDVALASHRGQEPESNTWVVRWMEKRRGGGGATMGGQAAGGR